MESESAKDCVTTHPPNVLALKMHGAQASHPYPTLRDSPCERVVNCQGRLREGCQSGSSQGTHS